MNITDVHAGNGLLSQSLAARIIDEAIRKGYKKSALRWRVSEAQRRAIQMQLLAVADLARARYECEYGFPETGIYAGIPFVVDGELDEDRVELEAVTAADTVGTIRDLAIPMNG